MSFQLMQDLFLEDLRELYDAEAQLVRALPKLLQAAVSEDLQGVLEEHIAVTRGQVNRLELIFSLMRTEPHGRYSAGMRGLIEAGEEAVARQGDKLLLDLGLVHAARRAEHYEILAYASLLEMASRLTEHAAIEELLSSSLEEEQEADSALQGIGEALLDSYFGLDGGMDDEHVGSGKDGVQDATVHLPVDTRSPTCY